MASSVQGIKNTTSNKVTTDGQLSISNIKCFLFIKLFKNFFSIKLQSITLIDKLINQIRNNINL